MIQPIITTLLVAGCGYGFRVPDHIARRSPYRFSRTIPRRPGSRTSAVVAAFSNSGRLKVMSAAQADSILEGEILGYSVQGTALDRTAIILCYRLQGRHERCIP